MKVRGVFLGPPSSTDKTTLIIKVRKRAKITILRIGIIRALNESVGSLFRAAKQHRKNKSDNQSKKEGKDHNPEDWKFELKKLKKIVGSNNFSAQFIKIISHYKKIGYNINVLQQTACFVVNPITVGNVAVLFNCTPVGRTSDSMMVPT